MSKCCDCCREGLTDCGIGCLTVPAQGEFLVRNGVVYRIVNGFYDTEGRYSADLERRR